MWMGPDICLHPLSCFDWTSFLLLSKFVLNKQPTRLEKGDLDNKPKWPVKWPGVAAATDMMSKEISLQVKETIMWQKNNVNLKER